MLATLNCQTFGDDNFNKQQDVEECLTTFISNCKNLKQLTKFETFKKRKCNNKDCLYESDGPIEWERTTLACEMNTIENALNITEEMVNNNKSIDFMICDECKLMIREKAIKKFGSMICQVLC